MKKYLIMAAGILLFSCTKTETTTQSSTPQKETVYVEKPAETTPKKRIRNCNK